MPPTANKTHPLHAMHTQKVAAGTFLFQEGELGDAMYIIVGGKLELRQRKGDTEGRIVFLLPGQVVGEKALLADRPYRRKHSVRALEDSLVIAVDRGNIGQLASSIPDFPLRILAATIERLDRANQLNDILMTTDPAERLVHYLLYQCQHAGEQIGKEHRLELSIPDLEYSLHVERDLLELALKLLTSEKLLQVAGKIIAIPSEKALLDYLPRLREKLLEKRLARLREHASHFKPEK